MSVRLLDYYLHGCVYSAPVPLVSPAVRPLTLSALLATIFERSPILGAVSPARARQVPGWPWAASVRNNPLLGDLRGLWLDLLNCRRLR